MTQTTQDTHGTDRLLRRRDVEALTGKSRSGIYEDMAAGRFPIPVRTGARSVAWRESDLRAWMAALPTAGGKGGQN